MRKNIDEAYRKQVIEFIVNFLEKEGFSNISRPETDESPALSIEDGITEKSYRPSLSAQKDDQIYLIEVETDGKYDPDRISKWKLYVKYLEENNGVFWMFVPSLTKEIFEASIRQNKLDDFVEVIAY